MSVYPDEGPVPAVGFGIENEADRPVTVRLTHLVPVGTAPSDVGFRPADADEWRLRPDGKVEFMRTLEPGERVVTVYFVRDGEEAALESNEPTVRVEPTVGVPAGDGGPAGEGDGGDGPDGLELRTDGGHVDHADADDDAEEADLADAPIDLDAESALEAKLRDMLGDAALDEDEGDATAFEDDPSADDDADGSAAADGDAGRPAGDGGETGGPTEPVDFDDPVDGAGGADVFATPFDGDAESWEEFKELRERYHPVSWGEVAATLVEEIRNGDVPEGVLGQLRAELGAAEAPAAPAADASGEPRADGPPAGAVTARLDRLESEVSKLAAYTEALESFIDEHGRGGQVIDDLQSRLSDLEAELDGVPEDVGTALADVADDVAAVESSLSSLRGDADANADAVEAVEAEVAAIDDRLAETADAVDELSAEVETVSGRLSSIGEELSEFRTAFAAVESGHEELTETVERMQAEREDVAGTVDALADDQDDLGETVESLADGQAQLGEAVDEVAATAEALDGHAEDIPEVVESVEAVEDEQDELRETVEALEAERADRRERMDELESTVEEAVAAAIEDHAETIDRLERNQRQIKGVFEQMASASLQVEEDD